MPSEDPQKLLHCLYDDLHETAISAPQNLVACSDMAGEVIAVGEDVKEWKTGDRVCANFSPEHPDGDITPEIMGAALGGIVDGVLTQYKAFNYRVCNLT